VRSNGLLLTRFPTQATESEYAQAAAELDGRLAELPEIVALYSFGSVLAPGISDIDRIAVVDGTKAVPEIWSQLSVRTRDLAMHAPFLIDAATFARHRWFADLGVPELVSGQAIDVEKRPLPGYTERLLAAEALVIMSLKLAKQAVTGRVKIRPLLCELNNLKLDLQLARLQRLDANLAWTLADEVERLRTAWWELEDDQRASRLRGLLTQAPPALAAAVAALSRRLDEADVVGQLRMSAEWRNVTLIPGTVQNGRPALAANIIGLSRRLGEARWLWIDRTFQIPPPVLHLLAGPARAEYEEFRARRADLVRRHYEHLTSTPSYSPIGLARVYLT
jgi:hypothetical protein